MKAPPLVKHVVLVLAAFFVSTRHTTNEASLTAVGVADRREALQVFQTVSFVFVFLFYRNGFWVEG
jgi:hypothetical protein